MKNYLTTTFKNARFTKLLLLFTFLMISSSVVFAQNSLNSGDFSTGNWGVGQPMTASAGTSLIITKAVSTSGDKFFRFFGDGSPCGEYQPTTNGDFFTHSTVVITPNGDCGNSKAWRINVPTITSNVVFKTDGNNTGISQSVAFVVQGAVQTVLTVFQNAVIASAASTITANLSGALSTGQVPYLRYSTNAFSTSTVVAMTGSGTTYTADIPSGTNVNGNTISYYVFTSGTSNVAADGSNADLFTLNSNNNSGSNYSYSVSAFGDAFSRNTLNPGNNPTFTYTNTLTTGVTAPITSNSYLDITHTTTSGISYVTAPTSSFGNGYNTTLSSNGVSLITWTLNFRWNRASSNNPAAPASAAYGQAIVLAGSSATLTTGTGYAIVYGSMNTPDPIRLVRYTSGIGTLFDICSSGVSDLSATNNYSSVRVTYAPATNQWSLYVRDDGVSAWADPISGVTAQKGSTAADSNYTGISLPVFGFLWSHANSAGNTGQFDNFKCTITPSSPPTIASFTVATPGSGSSGYVGNTVTVNGTNFQSSGMTVKVGGSGGTTVSSYTFVNSTQITFPAPNASGAIYIDNGTAPAASFGTYTNLGYITTTTGPWNTAGTWLGGAVPAASSDVTIAHALNIAALFANNPINSITVNTGITATVNATVAVGTVTNAITIVGTGAFTFTGASGSITTGSFVNNGTLSWSAAATLTIAAAGTLTNNTGATFTRGTGTVNFAGAGTSNGTLTAITCNNLTVNTGTITLTNIPTIDGTLTINGGSVSAAPIFTSNSTLFYNVAYSRFNEWNATGIGTIGTTAGYPNNVTINTGIFDIVNGANLARAINGNLLINTGATFNVNALNAVVTVGGNVTTTGTGAVNMGTTNQGLFVGGSVSIGSTGALTLSSNGGGDIYVAGNFANSGIFTHNTRAVFFNGSSVTAQTVSGSALNSTGANNCFAYFINNNSNAGVTIGANVTIDGTTGDVLQMLNSGTLRIGAFTLTVNGNGGNISVNGATGGITKTIDFTSASGILRIVGTGTAKTVASTSAGVLSITSSVAGGQVQVQNGGLDCGAALTTFGTGSFLTLLSGGFVANNSPTYNTGSTLSFRTAAAYGVGVSDKSWAIGASGAGVPSNVEVNAASTNVQINEDRTARGVVTVTAGTITNNSNTLNISTGLSLVANALIINGGTLTNGGGTVNIGVANGGNQSILMSSGALTFSSGTINENGNISLTGGTFTMSGGNFNIDPNDGVAAATADSFAITGATTTTVSGGIILFNDPPFNSSFHSFSYGATANTSWSGNTMQFGGSSGTNSSTSIYGFMVDTKYGTGICVLGHVIANGGAGTSKFLSSTFLAPTEGFDIGGNLTINATSEVRVQNGGSVMNIRGNILNNGTLTDRAGISFQNRIGGSIVSNSTAQMVSGSGIFQNNISGSTASFTGLTFDNTATSPAITFSVGNLSVSGATTFTNGIINIGANNDFTYIGAATSARTNGWLIRDAALGTGQMIRTFASTGSFIYAIGDGTLYSGITPNFTVNSVSRNIGFKITDATHPQNGNPVTPLDFLTRYWSMSENAAGGNYTFTLATTYNVAGDVNGTEANLQTAAWNGGAWTQYGAGSVASPTLTSGTITQATAPTLNGLDFTGRLSSGASYTWNGSGADGLWGTATNWTPNGIPGSSDQITIVTAGTNLALADARTVTNATFNGNFSVTAAGSLTVSGGVTYTSGTATWDCASTFTMSSSSAQTIPVYNYGNLNATGGNRTLFSSGTIGICGTFTRGAGVYTITGSTVNYNGTGAQTISAGTYNNLTITNARGSANLTSPTGTISVAGTFDVSGLSAYTPVVNASSIFNFSSAAAQTIPAFFYGQLNNSGNGNRTWASSGIIDINRGFSPGSGTHTITGSTVRYSDLTAGTWTMTSFTTNVASRQYNNLEFVGGASTVWESAASFNLGCAGTLTISGLGTLRISNTTTSNTLTVDGNTTISSGLLQNVGPSASAAVVGTLVTNNLTISGTGAINLDAASNSANAVVTVNSNMNVTSTTANAVNFGSGNANTNNVININGNFTKSGTGTIGLTGTNAASAIFNFNRIGTQTYSHIGAAQTGGGYTIASGSTLQLLTNLTLASSANTNPLNIAGTLDAGLFVIAPGNAANSFALSGTLSTANVSGVSATINGFTNGNTTWTAGATFAFSGTSVNTGMSGYAAISSATAYNLTWIGTTSLTLDKNLSLTTFNFTNSGLVNLGAFNMTIASGGSITGGSFSSSKMITTDGAGILIRSISGLTGIPFTWPIGETSGGAEYAPVTIGTIAVNAMGGSIGFKVIDAVQPNMGLATSYLSRYWNYTRTGLTAGTTWGNATFTYVPADVVVGPEASLKANVYDTTSGGWTEFATSSAASNVLTIASGPSTTTVLTGNDITGRIDVQVYYKSLPAGGNWSSTATWESSTNPAFVSGTGTTPVAVVPNYINSGGIEIINGSTVTVTSSILIDQTTINGTMTINSTFDVDINDGLGANDLVVNGTINNNSNFGLNATTNGTVQFSSSSTFNKIGSGGSTPYDSAGSSAMTVNWDPNSTLVISGIGGGAAPGFGSSETYGNVEWNVTGQSATTNLGYDLRSMAGRFRIFGTGTATVRLTGTTANPTISVGGDLIVEAGTLEYSNGNATNSIFNIGGSYAQSGGIFSANTSGNLAVNFTGTGNFNGSLGTLTNALVNWTVNNTSTITLVSALPVAIGRTLTVNGILNCGTNAVTGAGAFTLASGATLGMGSPDGIVTGSTTIGNLRNSGTRTRDAGGIYIYNGSVSQTTGTDLPTPISGTLRIANTGPATVTLTQATSISGTLSLLSGNLDLNALTLTMSGTSAQSIAGSGSNTFNIIGTAGSTLSLASVTSHVLTLSNFGTAVNANLITGANVNVQMGNNTQLDCAGNGTTTSMLTVLGTFTMNSATASSIANVRPPFYGAGSTLRYNISYGRFNEWRATSGAGYPFNVLVSAGTLDVAAGVTATARQCAGDLTINDSCTLSMGAMTASLNVLGNATIGNGASGTLTLSSVGGGDIYIGGNWTRNVGSTFNDNSRAVFLNGTLNQNIGGTLPTTFPFLILNNSAGATLAIGQTVSTTLTLTNGKLTLGTFDLTIAASGNIASATSSAFIISNSTGRLIKSNLSGSFTYPVGPSVAIYSPATLNQSGTTDNIGVRVAVAPAFTGTGGDPTQRVNLEWNVNEGTAGGNNIATTFNWSLSDEGTGFDRVSTVYHASWNGASYDIRTASTTSGSYASTSGANYTGNLSSHSFAVGNINGFKDCYQTIAAGDWATSGTWVGGAVPPIDATICVNHALTVNTASPSNVKGITLNTGGSLAILSPYAVNIAISGIVNKTSADSTPVSGTIAFLGSGTVSGANSIIFNNLTINSGTVTLTTTPTINGIFQINGGAISAAPRYGSTSTLFYNVNYNRFNEWNNIGAGTIGTTPGYPNNVTVNTGTLNVYNAVSGVARAMAGNLTVNNGGFFDCSTMNATLTIAGNVTINTGGTMNFNNNTTPVIVTGNFSNAGTLTLSSASGGDIKVGGDWTRTGTFTHNNRAVFFTGSGTNVVNSNGGAFFAYINSEKTGGSIQLGSNMTVSAPSGGNALSLRAAAGFDLNGNTLNLTNAVASNILADGGVVNFTGTGTINFGGATKTIIGSNSGTVVFGSDIAVTTSNSINFGSGISTVNGSLQINAGGFVENFGPTYGTSSNLIYNTAGTYNRNVEWGATIGEGFPNDVTIIGATTVNLANPPAAARAIRRNLNLGNASTGGSLTMLAMTNSFTVGGNVTIGATGGPALSTLTLSSVLGGDIFVAGNWTRNANGIFQPGGRAVFFNGTGTSVVTASSPSVEVFDYLVIQKSSGSAQIGTTTDITINTSVGDVLQLLDAGALDLNGRTFTFNNAGGTIIANGGARNITSTVAGGTIAVTASKAVSDLSTGTLVTNPNVRWLLTAGMNFGATKTTINGTLQLNSGGSVVTNPPTYASTSTLVYNSGTTIARGLEFSATSGPGYPGNVKIQNSTTLDFSANAANRIMAGNLILGDAIENTTGSLLMGASTASLTVNGNVVNGENTTGASTLTLSTAVGGNLTVNGNITVTNGNAINAPSDAVITLGGIITNSGTGTTTFQNGASLLQTGTGTNVGPIRYIRNTKATTTNFTFTYWGASVANQLLSGIWMSPNSADTFYTWNNVTNSWVALPANTPMTPGIGYIARARIGGTGTDYSGTNTYTSNTPWTARFNGVPNNADVPVTVTQSTNSLTGNLLANPYPSAIDISAFRLDPDNAELSGNFYFWTNNTPITNNAYNISDYAIFNVALNASVTTSGATPAPDQFVDAGQGFFADGLTAGTVIFKNTHRVAGNNNAFYRTNQNSSSQTTLDSSKIWLNLTNTQGLFKQQMLTYTQGATSGYDATLDARTFDGNSYIDFYSTAANEKLTIQSRAIPFVNTDLVSLGFKTSVAGNYKITIDHFDGLFANQTVYLQDNLLNIDHNLSLAPYNFATATGMFNNRFVLKYVSTVLGIDNPNALTNYVNVYKSKEAIVINSSLEKIEKVIVFDLLGRKVFEKTNLNTNEFSASNLVANEQVLLVKVYLQNGNVSTTKIVY